MVETAEKKTRTLSGTVVSTKMDKTITVQIERRVKHALYKKYVKRMTRLKAHDEHNRCKEFDKVVIEECRPRSKTKSWQLVEIVQSNPEAAE